MRMLILMGGWKKDWADRALRLHLHGAQRILLKKERGLWERDPIPESF